MTKEQIVEMYIGWKTGTDKNLHASDYTFACFFAEIDTEEIEKIGDAIIKERREV